MGQYFLVLIVLYRLYYRQVFRNVRDRVCVQKIIDGQFCPVYLSGDCLLFAPDKFTL